MALKWPMVLPPLTLPRDHRKALARNEEAYALARREGAEVVSIMLDASGAWRWNSGAWQFIIGSSDVKSIVKMYTKLFLAPRAKVIFIFSRRPL